MSDVAVFDITRDVDFSVITSSYVEILPAFEHVVRVIKFINNTDGDISLSYDGDNEHDFFPAGSLCVYDLTTNKADPNSSWALPKGTRLFIKYISAPTEKTFKVVCAYQRGQ
jgi:hypothetical protein